MKKNTKLLSLSSLCLISSFVPFIVSSCSCNQKQPEENLPIDINAEIKYEYFVGEQIKREDFNVELVYKDGTKKKVTDWTCSVELPYTFTDTKEKEFVIKHSGLERTLKKNAQEHTGKIKITFTADNNGWILDKQGELQTTYSIEIQSPVKWGRFVLPTVRPKDGYTFDKWLDKDGNPLYLDSVVLKEDTAVTVTFKKVDPSEQGMKFTKKEPSIGEPYYLVEWDTNQTLPENLVIPSTHTGDDGIACPVKQIGDFSNNPNVKKVTIPSTVINIHGSAFAYTEASDYSHIESVTFTGESNLETIGNNAFKGCGLLTSIEIPKTVTQIESNAFDMSSIDSPALSSVSFDPNGKLNSIGDNAFKGCKLLTNITLPNTIKTLGGFRDSGLTSITIPSSVTTITEYAFNTNSLNTVTFAEGSKLNKISDDAFASSSITTIAIPDSVTIIGARAFKGCTQLATVTFNDTSNLKTLGSTGGQVFVGSQIKAFNIPASVTSIGVKLFGQDSSSPQLKTLIYKDATSTWKLGYGVDPEIYQPSGDPNEDAQYFITHNVDYPFVKQ